MDASLDSFGVEDLETYIVEDTSTNESSNTLFVSANTHTILWDKPL